MVIPDLKEQPLTKLSPGDEEKFQGWIQGLPWYKEFVQKYNEAPNLNDPNYDYRAAYQAGISPDQRNVQDNMYHWPDFGGDRMMKSPYHPAAWAEYFIKQYGINPDTLPPDDPRIVQYKNAWYAKYPPRY